MWFGLEIIQFYLSAYVYDEYVINIFWVKEAVILNFLVGVCVFTSILMVVYEEAAIVVHGIFLCLYEV